MDLVLRPNTVVGQTVDIRIRKFQGNLRVAGVGDVFELSDTAAFIFRKVNGSRTVEEISAEVASHYDVQPDEIRDDVRELLTELIKNKVLEVVAPG